VVVRCSNRMLAAYCVLNRLTEAQRLVFCLVVIHSLELAEAAAVLRISLAHAEHTLDRAHTCFLRQAERNFRRLAHRKFHYLSLAAEIVREQDLALGGWWISEFDLLNKIGPSSRRPTAWTQALVPLILALTGAIAVLVSRVRGAVRL